MLLLRDVISDTISGVINAVVGGEELDLGQQSGTVLDYADLAASQVQQIGTPFVKQLSHPSLYGKSIAMSGKATNNASAGIRINFATPLSVTSNDVITLWFWQEWSSGSASDKDDYPTFLGETQVYVVVKSPNSDVANYICPMPWGRMRGWTPVQIDLSAASSPTTRGIMNTPVAGGADDDFLTSGIESIYMQCRDFNDDYHNLTTPMVYGGMVLNQKHNAFFMPYFDDGYRYIIDAEDGETITENSLELMNRLGQRGTCGIIADRILSSSYHYMTPANIHQLYEAGWDIGVHGEHYWGYRSDGIQDIKELYYRLTSSGTTATLQTLGTWMRNPVADGAQIVVNSADVSQYVGTFTATWVDYNTVTFTIPDAGDVAASTFNIDASWGKVAWSTQDERESAKAAVKADIEYNLAFLQNPYTKLTAAGFTGIDYLIGVDWTDGNPSAVLPANAWRTPSDWAYQLQAALDELGINSARSSNPIMENGKTYPVGESYDHYPTNFFIAGAVIENPFWLSESASNYNIDPDTGLGVDSTVDMVVANVIPATARQGGAFSPMIHRITDDPTTTGSTMYNRKDWTAVCETAYSTGLTSITATEYAVAQREAGDAGVAFKGTEHLSGLTNVERTAIDNFRRRLQSMGYWGSLKGLWIPALSGDNAKTNMITGVAVVEGGQGTPPTITWGSGGVSFVEGDYTNRSWLVSDISMSDVDNYSFGCYVKSYTTQSVAGIAGIMGAFESYPNDRYCIEMWNAAPYGIGYYHGGGSEFPDAAYVDIPDGTLVSARRRNGSSTNTDSSRGNITNSVDIATEANTAAFYFNNCGAGFDFGTNWTGSVFYIGEGVAHNQILMESAIKKLMSDLGY
tara:strand:- start:4499 stop:7069 length:2571 start_codon:yes stop_codon:yes gene_type:complete